MAPRKLAPRKLTTKFLASLQPGDRVRDTDVKGLFAERGKTKESPVSLKYQADVREGPRSGTARKVETLRMTLGQWPELPLDVARHRAAELRLQVRAGKDPRAKTTPTTTWTVEYAFEKYVGDLAKRAGTELSQRDMRGRLSRYLDDWRALPLASLTRELVEARQLKIAEDIRARAKRPQTTGAKTANAVVKDLGAVWDYASDRTPLPKNPARRVVLIGEVREHHEIPVAELAAWWAAVGAIKSPLRRALHRLGLLGGLRPGNLKSIERAWLRLEERQIVFPARVMKGRRAFTLPLSGPMVALVREALAAGDVLHAQSPYLFPSLDSKGKLAPMRVVREPRSPALLNRTGHALRHTYKTCARLARLPESQIMMLMAHRLGGMSDVYGSLADQFDRLLADQETVSAFIMARSCATSSQARRPGDSRCW